MKILYRCMLAGTVAIAAACSSAESGSGGAIEGSSGPPAVPVEVFVAFTDTVVETISATGQIEATQSVELRPEVEGRLRSVLAREGNEVGRGAALFRIDDAELRAQVARLEADRDLAEQALARTRELLQQNASSAADLERAEAAARSARAQLELQQVRLERTVVRAPFAGVLGERLVSIGDYVIGATPLTSLQTVDPHRAVFSVPERHARELERGQRVSFMVGAIPDRLFEGVVDFVDPRVRLPARTITVKAEVPNPDRLLKPGMFIEVRLATEVRPNAVLIPEDAILPLQGADYVWTVRDGVASRRSVELGIRIPGFAEVRSGVEAGEQVVVGGAERLSEGVQVAPTAVERQAREIS